MNVFHVFIVIALICSIVSFICIVGALTDIRDTLVHIRQDQYEELHKQIDLLEQRRRNHQ